jgi:monoamine oxidase
VLTMRANPLQEPGDWIQPQHAALDVPAHDWFRAQGLSERAIELAYGLNVSFGRNARDVSALLLLFRGAFSKSQRAVAPKDSLGYTARHGVQRICDAMAAAVRGGVELGHVVTGITQTSDHATVHCANGRRFTARQVIAAVPVSVLRRIALDPALPKAQAEAVASLPSQPLTQVYLAAKSQFWERDGYAPSLCATARSRPRSPTSRLG